MFIWRGVWFLFQVVVKMENEETAIEAAVGLLDVKKKAVGCNEAEFFCVYWSASICPSRLVG